MRSCLIRKEWSTALSRTSFSRAVLIERKSSSLKATRYFATVADAEAQNVAVGALQGIKVLDLSRILAVRGLTDVIEIILTQVGPILHSDSGRLWRRSHQS
jgi:hypothetical protein